MKAINDKIDELQGEINGLVDDAKEAADDVRAEIEKKIAELSIQKKRLQDELDKLYGEAKDYADDLVSDSKGFFAKYKVPVLIVAGLLVLAGIGLLLI